MYYYIQIIITIFSDTNKKSSLKADHPERPTRTPGWSTILYYTMLCYTITILYYTII